MCVCMCVCEIGDCREQRESHVNRQTHTQSWLNYQSSPLFPSPQPCTLALSHPPQTLSLCICVYLWTTLHTHNTDMPMCPCLLSCSWCRHLLLERYGHYFFYPSFVSFLVSLSSSLSLPLSLPQLVSSHVLCNYALAC